MNSDTGRNDDQAGKGQTGITLQLDAPPPVEKQKMELGVEITKTGSCERHVTVTIPRTDIDRYFKKQFDEIAPRAEVPGFRPGKAPRKLLEAKFQRQVAEQVKGALLMDSLSQLTDDQSFAAISEPDLNYELVKIPDEGPMIFEFNIEVRPEFDMPQWKGLTLKKTEHVPTDEMVDKFISRSFGPTGSYVETSEPVKLGNQLVCNIRVLEGSKEVSKLEAVELLVKPELYFHDAEFKTFGDSVVGKNVGDRVVCPATISEFADATEYHGKTLDVEFELVAISSFQKDEESASSESMTRYRKMTREYLQSRFDYEQQQELRSQILAALTKGAAWDLPPDLLKRQFRREVSRAIMEMKSSGLGEQEIAARESEMRRDALEQTKRLLQEHFILERIAEEEKVEDNEQDYQLEIARIAASSNETERRTRARLERTGQMDALRNLIVERKVIDLIQKHATIETKPYTLPPESNDFHVSQYLIGVDGESIPEAKYEEQQMPNIPGVDKPAAVGRTT